MIFADIIVPVPVPRLFTYRVGNNFADICIPGVRVIVPFGKKKFYTGIVRNVHSVEPEYDTKDIVSVLDDNQIISDIHLKFWDWISEYYMCTPGDVFKAALPAGLKLESETNISLRHDFVFNDLSQNELFLAQSLAPGKTVAIKDIQKKYDFSLIPIIKKLVDKNIINIEEKLIEKYKVKTETYIKLSPNLSDENNLIVALDSLKRAKKQSELLMSFLYISKYGSKLFDGLPPAQEFVKSKFLTHAQSTTAVLDQLISKGFIIQEKKEIDRINYIEKDIVISGELNSYQSEALEQIKENFRTKDVVLLHGVTSSGKTEIYIKLIEEQLNLNKQVLYLLPEIALTSQIINRLQNVFGNKAAVYHSKFSDSERVEIWKNLSANNNKSYQLILGVRSSVFLPFSSLGLIIVDEEHENTYKQYDPAPRYNAKDASMVLAKFFNAKVLLGTATPAFESYYNAKTGKYALVEITKRYADIEMPEIIISDTREARRKKQMKSLFSPLLINNIDSALKNKEQIILFQNRRGFSPYLECQTCAWIPKCEYCDVSMTYHKNTESLVCHYCGYTYKASRKCSACGDMAMTSRGFGTQKIEDEIKTLFPLARISRMDLDTTVSKNAYNRIISDFENFKTDILIGTQMVSKGLDFDKVSIVGIMNADNLLNFPNFRAYERSFQLMAQVSGRAGRKNKQGKVIIQTSDKSNKIIKFLIENDYQNLFNSQLHERKLFKYPPYYRLIVISIKHKDKNITDMAAENIAALLKNIFKDNVLGPEYPIISRIKNFYIKNLIIKIDRKNSPVQAKSLIMKAVDKTRESEKFKYVNFVFDVDPM